MRLRDRSGNHVRLRGRGGNFVHFSAPKSPKTATSRATPHEVAISPAAPPKIAASPRATARSCHLADNTPHTIATSPPRRTKSPPRRTKSPPHRTKSPLRRARRRTKLPPRAQHPPSQHAPRLRLALDDDVTRPTALDLNRTSYIIQYHIESILDHNFRASMRPSGPRQRGSAGRGHGATAPQAENRNAEAGNQKPETTHSHRTTKESR